MGTVPDTYEEIFEISNRNRGRNKEKKRLRDDDDDTEDNAAGKSKSKSKSVIGELIEKIRKDVYESE